MPESQDARRALADTFRALGHPVRLDLLQRIVSGEFCVTELQRGVGQSQPSISQHLGILRDRGLIVPIRRGNRTCYRARDDRLAELLQLAEAMLASR